MAALLNAFHATVFLHEPNSGAVLQTILIFLFGLI